jgi:hypothetical protein
VLASTGLTEPQKLSSLLLVNVYVRGPPPCLSPFRAYTPEVRLSR